MKHEDLTKKIIGCAYEVYNRMGYGFLESVYEKCLLIELKKAGLSAEAQKRISVIYENEDVGDFIADIIVENQIILELKSIHQIVQAHEVQLVNYLTATKKDVGLLINFGEQKVEIKRKVRELKPTDQQDQNPVHPVHPV
ncbi:MAG: GxxExxY protein [Kiritimatiellia bacterium]|jgi:GxxExxY protein|nr:GxxExxY protein [Kiritimatiellia bacterium]